ncbi:hypothetical protein AMECASPLE_005192 [Ameca splendens]|uniref:Uncharacterized protein n=1 Tax=Ameca splendens TaxID=208324 RepID=A0ABV0XN65_9TELE
MNSLLNIPRQSDQLKVNNVFVKNGSVTHILGIVKGAKYCGLILLQTVFYYGIYSPQDKFTDTKQRTPTPISESNHPAAVSGTPVPTQLNPMNGSLPELCRR